MADSVSGDHSSLENASLNSSSNSFFTSRRTARRSWLAAKGFPSLLGQGVDHPAIQGAEESRQTVLVGFLK
jgi:hypothetical protein